MLERIHLTIIREVERLGTLTAAAEALHLTQSALSHTIKKLESQSGVKIWHREGRHLRLTQAGEYVLSVANRLLPQLWQADERMKQYGKGERGTLRIGMECHPCYTWLLKIVSPYLKRWPYVDVDVKQKFQFGGVGALFGDEIDILVTPDPLYRSGLRFESVFDYEQVLVVGEAHRLRGCSFIEPKQLREETLITYPVDIERLDIYNQFMIPAGIMPKQSKVIETTDILLQMVASGRGVAALPKWLVEEYSSRMPIFPIRLGEQGIFKHIFLGRRESDEQVDYVDSFVSMACEWKV